MKQYMKGNLEQLKSTIDALIDAEERVELHCWEYSCTTEEYQQECLDMFEFRKMVFEYDKEKVIEHFNNMSKELQSLSNGVLLEDRLVMTTKILKSEMY